MRKTKTPPDTISGSIYRLCAAFLAGALLAAAAPPSAAANGNSKPSAVSYEKDVQPLLRARCYACHGNGTRLGGFQIDTREGLLTGGQVTHPVVLPGKGAQSYLIRLVSGQVPGKIMPSRGPKLTAVEIALLIAWIDQGMNFGSLDTGPAWKPSLTLRAPAVPKAAPGSGLSNSIDLLLQPYFHEKKIQPGAPVDDRTYARRVYLDLIGLLPSPAELDAFLKDTAKDKRARLAQKLLNDNQGYTEHWLTFWNDLLRNDYAGTGYIDGGRTQITGWLYNALATNMPYDRFVRELVKPTAESAGFVKGIVWRGVVNASQTPQMQAAQNISQVFMGVNLKCASCHDSFINTWKLADSYGMAGIYAEGPLEMVRCDRPTGKVAPIHFLYPELGAIDGTASRDQRMEQLAGILTSHANGRFPRTLVNRLWGRLMGRGLVEPQDDMDQRPWSPEVLDWLAADFVQHGYDVKHTLEQIVTSRAYQFPVMTLLSERVPDFRFRGPVVKRMTAEQFADAVSTLTGVWPRPATQFQIVHGKVVVPSGLHGGVRYQSEVMKSGSVDVDVDLTGAQVLCLVVTDAGDGEQFDWADWADARLEGPQGELRLTDLKWFSASVGYGQIQLNKSIVQKPLRLGERTFENGIGTHANSVIAYLLPPGYTRFKAVAGPDTGAVESPGSKTSITLAVVTGDRSLLETRAALALADPLTRALGRPNREQLVTERATTATTLQALELTNGLTLNGMLEQGAARWVQTPRPAPELVDAIYLAALGRKPIPSERQTALAIVGSPATKEGVQDILWAITMLPEFQLVY